jgi:hypothetical protein
MPHDPRTHVSFEIPSRGPMTVYEEHEHFHEVWWCGGMVWAKYNDHVNAWFLDEWTHSGSKVVRG